MFSVDEMLKKRREKKYKKIGEKRDEGTHHHAIIPTDHAIPPYHHQDKKDKPLLVSFITSSLTTQPMPFSLYILFFTFFSQQTRISQEKIRSLEEEQGEKE